MRVFAIAVFALHVLAETAFGLRGFLSGAFSWQAGVDVGAFAAQISGSARFLASGLLALALLGLLVLVGSGVRSETGRVAAIVLAAFHLVGVLGVLLTGLDAPGFLATLNAQGALGIHALLGLGFLLVAVRRRAM